MKEYDRAREQITVDCPHCNGEIVKKRSIHLQSHKCKKKPHPNDDLSLVGGGTYLKGKSPLGGVWHRDHTPFEVKQYVIFDNNVPRGVNVTTI